MRNTTPDRTEAQTKQRATSSKPRQTVQTVRPSSSRRPTSERYSTTTLRTHNRLKGLLNELISMISNEKRTELIRIRDAYFTSMESIPPNPNFIIGTIQPRTMDGHMPSFLKDIDAYLNKFKNTFSIMEENKINELKQLIKPFQSGGKKKSKNKDVVKELKRPLLKNEQHRKSNS